MRSLSKTLLTAAVMLGWASSPTTAQTPPQPRVAPGPNEPDWVVLLDRLYGLKMMTDLSNPAQTPIESTPGTFRKAGPGPVQFTPILALGLETTNRGGWYRSDATPLVKNALWSYRHKHTATDFSLVPELPARAPNPPPLMPGSTTSFDPGDTPFGLWVANDGLTLSDVYTEPRLVAQLNPRLAKQPYKVMIYPTRDQKSGTLIPNSYLIGWEYSTNDDFQDVVARLDNVHLTGKP